MKNVKFVLVSILLMSFPAFSRVEVLCVITTTSLITGNIENTPNDAISIRIKELEKLGKTVEVTHLVSSTGGAGYSIAATENSRGFYNGVVASQLCASLKY